MSTPRWKKALKLQWKDVFSRANSENFTLLNALRENLLFVNLTEKELKLLSKLVHLRHFDAHELIFEQYEKGLGMYIIAKGAVDVRVRDKDDQDQEIHLTTLKEGSFFGELALVDIENKRTASAYAQGPSILIGFFKPDLMELMERRPTTGVKILFQLARVLGKRLTDTTEAAAFGGKLTPLHVEKKESA